MMVVITAILLHMTLITSNLLLTSIATFVPRTWSRQVPRHHGFKCHYDRYLLNPCSTYSYYFIKVLVSQRILVINIGVACQHLPLQLKQVILQQRLPFLLKLLQSLQSSPIDGYECPRGGWECYRAMSCAAYSNESLVFSFESALVRRNILEESPPLETAHAGTNVVVANEVAAPIINCS